MPASCSSPEGWRTRVFAADIQWYWPVEGFSIQAMTGFLVAAKAAMALRSSDRVARPASSPSVRRRPATLGSLAARSMASSAR